MKYLFWNLSDVEYKGRNEILNYCLRNSDTFKIKHVMKENEWSQGIKLYSIDSANTPKEKELVWNNIFEYALENSFEFNFQYELNEKSEWLNNELKKTPGLSISELIEVDKHNIIICCGKLNQETRSLIKILVQDERLSYDEYDWDIEIIDNKLDRGLFYKANHRMICNGRGYVATELTEDEIDEFNKHGYAINEIVEYKHRVTVCEKLDEEYIKIIEEEAERVNNDEVANLMKIKIYAGVREMLRTDLKHEFIICLSESEMREIDINKIDTSKWKLVSEKDGYIAPNDYLSGNDRIRLSFKEVKLDVEGMTEAVNKFFAKFKEN